MASLKDLRGRIRSVKNTQQITKTMKMVSAAKVRRARNQVEATRPYADRLLRVLNNLAGSAGETGPLMLTGRPNVKQVRLIVIGADRGLCGGFNTNLAKHAAVWVKDQKSQGRSVQVVAVGRKVRDIYKHTGLMVQEYVDISRNIDFTLAETIAEEALNAFTDGTCDEVHVLYSECVSMLTQTPTAVQVLPFTPRGVTEETTTSAPEYEPDEAEILADLLPAGVKMTVFQGLLESAASEQAARMTAMDNATRNAGDMIKALSLEYNRSRQAAITKELIEIISGAQAV